jgi:hypothetical protein
MKSHRVKIFKGEQELAQAPLHFSEMSCPVMQPGKYFEKWKFLSFKSLA